MTTFKNNCGGFFDPRPFTLDPRLVTLDPRLVAPRPSTLDPRPKGKLVLVCPRLFMPGQKKTLFYKQKTKLKEQTKQKSIKHNNDNNKNNYNYNNNNDNLKKDRCTVLQLKRINCTLRSEKMIMSQYLLKYNLRLHNVSLLIIITITISNHYQYLTSFH